MATILTKGISVDVSDWKIVNTFSKRANIHTKFQIASISKFFTSILVAKLVQLGFLNYDIDINTYLTSWKCPKKNVHLRKLLSHTAGADVGGFPGYKPNATLPTNVQILNGEKPANTRPVIFKYRKFSYAGGGYQIIQQVITDVMKKPFWSVMKTHIIDPLKLTDTTARIIKPAIYKDIHVYQETAAAGVWSSISDLLIISHDLAKSYQTNTGIILKKKYARQIMTLPQPADYPYALGCMIENGPNGKIFGHDGNNYRFRSRLKMSVNGTGSISLFHTDVQFNDSVDSLEKLIRDTTQ